MKQKIKFFGIGLFCAGLLFSIGERVNIPYIESAEDVTSDKKVQEAQKESKSLKKTIDELQTEINDLKSQLEEAKNTSTTKNQASDNNSKTDTNTATDTTETESQSEEVVTGTIYVYETVSLYDIGRQAEDLKIVENGRELELFLSKPEYARSVQKGQFELRSDMTIEEMANILTGKK